MDTHVTTLIRAYTMDRIKHLFNLHDKVAIVTGASKGIGESIARGLAEFGAKVVISSRNQEAVDQVAGSYRKQGLEATGIACHVGKAEQREQLVRQTVETYGGIDILVCNAATNPFYGSLTDVNEAVYDKIMDINVKACFLLGNLCYPIMKERGGGSIINIASVAGLQASVGLAIYSVSKAALIMLTQNQAKEWGPVGIRSNVICPGLIQTKFSEALWKNEAVLESVEKRLPSRRMAQPDEMAGVALMLASDSGSYCTGGVYTADGGHMITG